MSDKHSIINNQIGHHFLSNKFSFFFFSPFLCLLMISISKVTGKVSLTAGGSINW